MAAVSTTLIAIGSIVTAGAAINEAEKSRKAQQNAAATQRKAERARAAQSQRRANREVLIRRAQAKAQAEALGGSGGSAIAGGISSLTSQFGSAVGFAGQMSGLSQDINMFQAQAASAQARSEMFGTASSILGNNLGGFQTVKSYL